MRKTPFLGCPESDSWSRPFTSPRWSVVGFRQQVHVLATRMPEPEDSCSLLSGGKPDGNLRRGELVPPMKPGFIEVAGPEGAPALVLLHGVTVNRMVWLQHLPLLAVRHRVLALDLPGHGARAGEPFGLAAATDLLRSAVSSVDGGRALVVGDSLGGYAALAFASRHPELLSGLVLASCTLPMGGPVGLLARSGAFLLSPAIAGSRRPGLLRRIAEARIRGSTEADVADPVLSAGVRLEALPEAYTELAGRDFPGMLRGFPGPVLLLNGQRDLPFRLWERAYLASARNGRLRLLKGARHTASRDVPDQFVASILAFASDIGW